MCKINIVKSREEILKSKRCRSMINETGITDDEKRILKMKLEACLIKMRSH